MHSLVIFGDEIGIPLVLNAIEGNIRAYVVVDPKRQDARKLISSFDNQKMTFFHPAKPDRERFVAKIAALAPTLGVVASYSRLLWPELISVFSHGVVNLHNGRLPEYRGANVLQWVIINGESETSVTLHYVDNGIDSGPIIAQMPVEIKNEDTALSLRRKMTRTSRMLLNTWLPRLLTEKLEGDPQDEGEAKTWPRRRPEDGRIDWSWSDPKIRNLSRALVRPWPGVFYIDGSGKKVVIDKALSLEQISRLRRKVSL